MTVHVPFLFLTFPLYLILSNELSEVISKNVAETHLYICTEIFEWLAKYYHVEQNAWNRSRYISTYIYIFV